MSFLDKLNEFKINNKLNGLFKLIILLFNFASEVISCAYSGYPPTTKTTTINHSLTPNNRNYVHVFQTKYCTFICKKKKKN